MGASVNGTNRLNGWLAKLPGNIMEEVRDELEDIGEDLHDKSVRAAPIDTGALKASGFYTVHYESTGLTLVVGFQGLPYIIVQHEKGWLNFMGQYGPKDIERYHGGGGEKFLERPWLESKQMYVRRLHAAVRRGTRRM